MVINYDLFDVQEGLTKGLPFVKFLGKGRRMLVNVMPSDSDYKICTNNCVFCQYGPTDEVTGEISKKYVSLVDVERNLEGADTSNLEEITLVGFGEGLINENLGEIISFLKDKYKVPVAVLTNGNMLYDEKVREGLYVADVVIPTLVSANQDTFERITRPVKGLNITNIVEGMVEFNRNFSGEFLLEIMLIGGMNTSRKELGSLVEVVRKISPNEVVLNTVIREPCQVCESVENGRMKEIQSYFSRNLQCNVRVVYDE